MQLIFEDAYAEYKKYIDIRLKPQSKRTLIERFEKHILPYWSNYDIYFINSNNYLDWQQLIENKNYSYNFKRNLHYIFTGFLDYCIKYHGLTKNVARDLGCFKKRNFERTKHDFYTYNEFKKFIKAFDNNIYKQFFNFMFFTGTRPGEAMALKFSDLNNSIISINKTIDEHCDCNTKHREIGTPKTYTSYRNIRIDFILNKALLKLKKYYFSKYNDNNYDYYIFGGKTPLSPTTINRYKEKACNKSGIRKIKLHEFRHSHATLLLHKGIVINEIAKRLGHSDVSITLNTYTHTNELQEKRVIKTLLFLRLF